MNFVTIVGSHREASQSTKVANFTAKRLESLGHEVTTIDLRKNPLPLWDEGVWAKEQRWQTIWQPISQQLEAAHGAVIVAPEWSGMVPAGLKNFFLLVGKELAHKPALIVSVSSGRGGAYPVAELRMSSYKNTFINYIPDHVIVRDVEEVLNSPQANGESDELTRNRIDYSCKVLELYAVALQSVRDAGVVDFKTYPFGM